MNQWSQLLVHSHINGLFWWPHHLFSSLLQFDMFVYEEEMINFFKIPSVKGLPSLSWDGLCVLHYKGKQVQIERCANLREGFLSCQLYFIYLFILFLPIEWNKGNSWKEKNYLLFFLLNLQNFVFGTFKKFSTRKVVLEIPLFIL